jgi:hypothetical protein
VALTTRPNLIKNLQTAFRRGAPFDHHELATLLKNCPRVKVARLCVRWAEELNLPWAAAAKKAVGNRLGQSRWTARLKDGTTLVLKP